MAIVYIKEFLIENAGNPQCPLFVFMSATFDIPKYAKYFDTPPENGVIVYGGESKYSVTFLEKNTSDFITDAANLAYKIHQDNPDDEDNKSDILIFVPDMKAGGSILRILESKDTKKELLLYKLEGSIINKGGDDVAKIETMKIDEVKKMEKRKNVKRRITVSTSVAQTGITIKSLKYVIECGFDKTTFYSPIHHVSQLLTKNVVRSSVEQRFGRVGRDFPGHAFGMYTKDTYEKLPEYEFPETFRSDITKEILEMLYSNISSDYIFNPLSFKDVQNVIKDCTDLNNLQLSDSNFNCQNIYCNTILDKSNFVDIKKFYKDEGFFNHPKRMLDNIPQDSFIAGRNKALLLGLYGTYAGFIVSKMSRISIEGARMIIASVAYGVSLSDACMLAVLSSAKKEYIVPDGLAKFSGIPAFNRIELYRKIISKNILMQFYYNDLYSFINMIQDDFIDFLAILQFIIKCAKEYKSDIKLKPAKGWKKGKNPNTRLEYIGYECFRIGINFSSTQQLISQRLSIIKDCAKLGIYSNIPNLSFTNEDIISQIMRIKRVLYAGLKGNIAHYDEKKKVYITSSGLEILTTRIGKHYPKKIMYGSLFMKNKGYKMHYNTSADIISSLDGIF